MGDGGVSPSAPQRCPPNDFVCELIMLHTSGVLTQNTIQNLTNSIDDTWKQTVALDISVGSLTKTIDDEVRDTQELRHEINAVDRKAQDNVKRLKHEVQQVHNNSGTMFDAIRKANKRQDEKVSKLQRFLDSEMKRVNNTLERDATKQVQERRRIAELEKGIAEWKAEAETRKMKEFEAKREDRLEAERRQENRTRRAERERIEYEDKKSREREADAIQEREKSAMRQEEERRKTEEALQAQRHRDQLALAQLELDTAVARAKAEAEGRAKQERDNEDIAARKQEREFAAVRERLLDAINLIFRRVSEGGRSMLEEPRKLVKMVGFVVALFGGIYTVRELS